MTPVCFTAAEIANLVGGKVLGQESVKLTGFAAAANCKPGDLTFAENDAYFAKAEESAAAAILVGNSFVSARKTLIKVANPRVAFARVLPLFFPPERFSPGTHATAIVAASAQIDPSAHIGPYCVIGERVRIGPRCVL